MPEGIQGISQQPVVAGHAQRVRCSAMTSYDAHDRGVHAKCLRTDQHKLVICADETYGELFDLVSDPQERQNRFDDPAYSGIKQQLMERLIHRLMQDQDPLPVRRAFW